VGVKRQFCRAFLQPIRNAIGEKNVTSKTPRACRSIFYLTTIPPLYELDGVKWMVNEKPSRFTRAS
jgi:hypothetical protein